ncbi:synaptonemal complex protein 1-like [Temnothorax curvispinosus]|uniref:Synaptonemal complex protein 1-like n=1 Tax=Temnothorax curvispinosus TaxID=300111 RepID=A0A6J1PYD4_9HYME|nr:synaptonemal complex protein 1-like [Temnothorax curvispinosus]XP_024874874.1 synaptonemal complex protein 1-like [Temnothorax curvispinosus]
MDDVQSGTSSPSSSSNKDQEIHHPQEFLKKDKIIMIKQGLHLSVHLLNSLKDKIEIERELMRQQKADLTLEETKKVVKSDKELISERNAEFLRTQIENASRNLPNFAATVQNKSDRTSENLEESREHNAELRENMKKLENEMSKYEKKLEIAMEEQERLISSLALTNELKEILEADLWRTTEELRAREQEVKNSSNRELELARTLQNLYGTYLQVEGKRRALVNQKVYLVFCLFTLLLYLLFLINAFCVLCD